MGILRNPLLRFRKTIWLAGSLAFALLVGLSDGASAQQAILAPGNAAVTGFSGAIPPAEIAPGIDPGDLTFIDGTGASLRIVDLQHMGGPPSAQLVKAPKLYSWFANQIGQVFGVAVDDSTPPNIYVAATSAYGLPIVVAGPDGKPRHVKTGAANAVFMQGLWGAAPNGGPGSIWKIDGTTGAVSLFANVALDGRPNSGAALGGLAFDPESKSLFVADRETGFIHRFGMNGTEISRYDHGVTGRKALGLAAVVFDPARRLDITSPQFDTGEPATWHFAAPERRVFGLGIFEQRLYYAVAAGLQIWSVGIKRDGSFGADARIEIVVPAGAGPTEISKITFDEQNRIFLGERPAPTGAYDFEALTPPGIGRVLRYASVGVGADERHIWQKLPDEYAIGFPGDFRNGNGGVAIGYRYDPKGNIEPSSCGGFIWSTGEDLRNAADAALARRLKQSGRLNVDGLQGNETWRIRRDDEPPHYAYFIDYDDRFDDTAARGQMGDVAIVRACTPPPLPQNFILPTPAAPPRGTPPKMPPGVPPGTPPGTPPTSSCPPGTPPSACPPPGPCPEGQVRGRHRGQCQSCTRPNVQIGNTCCTPADLATGGACVSNNPGCAPGETAVGPSNFCCNNGQVYTDSSGAEACCMSGVVTNGQCPPPPPPTGSGCTPSPNNPSCPCPGGYMPTGNTCCLSSQVTSTGVCCPAGEVPSGPGKSRCEPLIPIHFGPSCCSNGLIPVGISGGCCAPANVTTTGICCSQPVDPKDRTHCPAQIQSIIKCAPGYTKMPDGTCCNDRFVSADGKSCHPVLRLLPPPHKCAARGPRFIRDPHNPTRCIACSRGRVANDDHTACVRLHRLPPPVANCAARGRHFIRNPHNPRACIACPRGLVANSTHTACVRRYPGGPPPTEYGPPYIGPGPVPPYRRFPPRRRFWPHRGWQPLGGPGLGNFGR